LLGIPLKRKKVEHQYAVSANALEKISVLLPERPAIIVQTEWEDSLAKILAIKGHSGEPIAVLHPGAPWKPRRWPIKNFIAIAKELSSNHNLKIVIVGVENEKEISDAFRQSEVPFIDLIGVLDIGQLAALFKISSVYIGNDSGPAHLAAAVCAKVLVFYGPQDSQLFGALAKRSAWLKGEKFCSPCWQCDCPFEETNCMNSITLERAKYALKCLMESDKT
jgi:ADP-heptose:LPS heptosyltransferase